MVGILIATHGEFAAGLLNAAELILGKQKKCKVLSLFQGDDITAFGKLICSSVAELDDGDGVLIFTDLFLASPSNQVAANYPQLKGHNFKTITGVNLPMLLEAIGQRIAGGDLENTAAASLLSGQSGIRDLLVELNPNKA